MPSLLETFTLIDNQKMLFSLNLTQEKIILGYLL